METGALGQKGTANHLERGRREIKKRNMGLFAKTKDYKPLTDRPTQGQKVRVLFDSNFRKGFQQLGVYEIEEINPAIVRFKGYEMNHNPALLKFMQP